MHHLTAMHHCRRGSSVVEFAFALPVVVALLGYTVEGGRALWIQNALQYAVERAARCATVDATMCGSVTQVQSYAALQAQGTTDASHFSVATASCGTEVSAAVPFVPVMPVPLAITLRASSCRPT